LANIKIAQDDTESGIMLLDKAYNHYKETLGNGHHRTADVQIALGRQYKRQAKYDEAL